MIDADRPVARDAAATRTLIAHGYVWSGQYWQPPAPDLLPCPDPFVVMVTVDGENARVLAVMSERRAQIVLAAGIIADGMETAE